MVFGIGESGGWNSRDTYNGMAQQYVYTGNLIKEELASYGDIAALLGREVYNCGGKTGI